MKYTIADLIRDRSLEICVKCNREISICVNSIDCEFNNDREADYLIDKQEKINRELENN